MMVGKETWWNLFVTLENFFFEAEIEARWPMISCTVGWQVYVPYT